MGFYDEMQNIASGIFSEFAQGAIKLIKAGAKTGDPWKPATGSTTEISLDGAANGVSAQYVTSGLAVAGDIQITCAVPATLPEIADSVLVDNVLYKVVNVIKKPAAGTPVVFVLICRKG